MTKVVLACDFGLSGTKATWAGPDGRARLLIMGSEIIELRASDLRESGLAKGKPEQDAWVTFADGATVALGLKAQQMQGRPPFNETKYRTAVFKIAAVAGTIAEELGVSKIDLYAGALLPYVEYRDRERFQTLVTTNLKDYEFRGRSLQVTIKDLYVAPEGAGIAESYAVSAESRFETQNTLILMLGHRDLSVLPYRQGTYIEHPGAQIGFQIFLDDVMHEAAIGGDNHVKSLVAGYLFNSKYDDSYLKQIAGLAVKGRREVSHKVEQLERAIEQSRYRYLNTLFSHLNDLGSFLYEADQVLISGGPVLYWLEDLEAFFGEYPQLEGKSLMYKESLSEIERVLGPLEEAMLVRLGDVFGLFDRLMADEGINVLSAQERSPETTLQLATPTEVESGNGNGIKEVQLPKVPAKTAKRTAK